MNSTIRVTHKSLLRKIVRLGISLLMLLTSLNSTAQKISKWTFYDPQTVGDCYREANLYFNGLAQCDNTPYVLVFNDDFDLNTIDRSKWKTLLNWGRKNHHPGELQGYFDENIKVSDGTLKITARKEQRFDRVVPWDSVWSQLNDGLNYRQFNYTSGTLVAHNVFKYGKYEIRFRTNQGGGLWPAFWLFGGDSWNELDMFDNYGEDVENQTFIGGLRRVVPSSGREKPWDCGAKTTDFADFSQWHTLEVEYTPFKVAWRFDGILVRTIYRYTNASQQFVSCGAPPGTYGELLAFPDANMQLILNLAVRPEGLNNDVFPGVLEVDYVRVYQRKSVCGQKTVTIAELNPDPDYYDYFGGESLNIDSLPGLSNRHALRFEASEKVVFKPGFYAKPKTGVIGEIKDFECAVPSEQGITGKRTLSKSKFSVYPVPVSDFLRIDFANSHERLDIQNFIIFDLAGNNLLEGEITSGVTIDICNFTPGFYFIKIFNDYGVLHYEKFVKD